MSQEYRAAQGSIIPSLFIGLGGVGSRIVDRIARRAKGLPNWSSQLEDLTGFVSIDTNELDQHQLRDIPEGNRLNIAGFDKARVIENLRRSKDRQALQWLDGAYQPRSGYKPGAGQIRVEARLGFFYHSPAIRQRLQQVVGEALRPNNTWRQAQPPKYNVYLFTTLAGGTGSGAFLSVAYLVDDLIRAQNWQPRVISNLMLSTLILDKVGPELHADIHANTYAALKELEHLTKLDYAQVKREGRTREEFVYWRDENSDEVPEVGERPFFISFIHDRPAHLELPDVESAIADAAYLQLFTPVIDNLAGELDNYEKKLEELTRFPGDLRNVGLGYTKNFGAYGAVALAIPTRDLLEYCALRFAGEAVRSQITFGVDRSDPSDDRALALAKLAVNYSDPRFLNMGEEGRENAINQAFVRSVQEMARQDRVQELEAGFWARTVEVTDEGPVTGVDERGEATRGESRAGQVARLLEAERDELLNKVSIKDRAFTFHKEGVNQYVELVGRLREDLRAARQQVEEGGRGVEAGASEGDVIRQLRLDPVSERYLTLRLLELCEREWLPATEQELENAHKGDIENANVRERLERELYESLREAAGARRWFRSDQAFLDMRDEAQEYYRRVSSSSRKKLGCTVQLRQLRAFHGYLRSRARQYARLATRMDALVLDLEAEAEAYRRRERAIAPSYALRVEAFETLEEPRERIWDRVYRALFIEGGRYLATFDRQRLADAISRELRPVARADGTVAAKSIDQVVGDLRRALLELAHERLAPAIVGSAEQDGLTLPAALELEARLMLRDTKGPGESVTDAEIDAYQERKFRALGQLAGVLARVQSAESSALDDGVVSARTRQLIISQGNSAASQSFVDRLKATLGRAGRQVKGENTPWHDPALAIVHDVELPIPLYYIEPITGDIEDAYLLQAADERRSYNLHTDFNWEKSLPNLNPRRSEIAVGWALEALADGLLGRVIAFEGGRWVWNLEKGEPEELGGSLSKALYNIGEIHRLDDLRATLERQLDTAKDGLGLEAGQRRARLAEQFNDLLGQLSLRERRGEITRDDVLDRPVLRALIAQLESDTAMEQSRRDRSSLYRDLDLG